MTVSDHVRKRMASLALATPEWRSWLELLQETLDAVNDPVWTSVEPRLDPAREAAAPVLARAEIHLDPALARGWLRRLVGTVARSVGPGAASLGVAAYRLGWLRFLEAAVCQDLVALADASADSGADAKALTAL